jgi:hypothetical protein
MKLTLKSKNNKRSGHSSNEVARRLLKKKFSRLKRSLFLLIVTFSLVSFQNSSYERTYVNFVGPIIEDKVPELTPENVFAHLERLGIKHPEIVLKQSILETGWYECQSCSLRHNNIFGFRYKKKYLQFENWIEGVEYYKKWQDKRYEGGDYYGFLKDVGYATSRTYISKLKQIKVDFL